MNGAQARLMLDGAEAWLSHVSMPIKDLTNMENAYHVLRNTINAYYSEEHPTLFEDLKNPSEWGAFRKEAGQ